MDDAKLYAMSKTRTPYKDQMTRKWVVRWEENGVWKQETFDADSDAWYFYYKKYGEKQAEYQPRGRGK